MNRETWLNTLLEKLHSHFTEIGYSVPDNIRVSVGFPSKGIKSKVIGECWDMTQSTDGQFEIFIHPNQDDPVKVAGIMVHELVHTIVGIKAKHGADFKKCATKAGLCGKMKATTESPALKIKLEKIVEHIGRYPHSKLQPTAKPISVKVQNSFKLLCGGCQYTVRTSKKWLKVGMPICPCGNEMMPGF